MRIFTHEGCHSGQCVFKASVVARLVKRAVSDKKNHEFERARDESLLREAMRLMDENCRMGLDPVPK